MNRLEADVFPVIGHMPMIPSKRAIFETSCLRSRSEAPAMSPRDIISPSGRSSALRSRAKLGGRNPAAKFRPRDILAAAESENFARVDEKDLPELLAKMDDYLDTGRLGFEELEKNPGSAYGEIYEQRSMK
jgi:hypothetical protein